LQSAEAAQTKDNMSEAVVSYSIVREKDGKTQQIAADENTAVLPGDVIKVEANLAMR
ncbi:MAG: sugar ABC transporter substrate-binding protein, partial [Ensifer adhaerens]